MQCYSDADEMLFQAINFKINLTTKKTSFFKRLKWSRKWDWVTRYKISAGSTGFHNVSIFVIILNQMFGSSQKFPLQKNVKRCQLSVCQCLCIYVYVYDLFISQGRQMCHNWADFLRGCVRPKLIIRQLYTDN